MPIAAASRYPTPNMSESIPLQLTEEEFEKLQEIHELITMMLRELPVSPQNVGQPYYTSTLPISRYTHPYLPWNVSPYLTPPGF